MATSGSGGGGGGSAGGIRGGRAFVELGTKDLGLKSGLAAASGLIRSFGTLAKTAFVGGAAGTAAMVAGLAAVGKSAMDRAVEFERLSKRIGVPVDQLSAFAYAAGTTGQEIGDLEGHFENFAERVHQAAMGTGEAATTFQRLGINARELVKLNPAEQMMKVADAMSGLSNDTTRRGILSSLGSDQFQGLNDLFKGGSEGIRKLMAEAKSVGAVLDPKQTADQATASKELARAWTAGKNAVLSLGSAILPSAANAKKFADAVVYGLDQAKAWIATGAEMVRSFTEQTVAGNVFVQHFGEVGSAIGKALEKGDPALAFELAFGEIELLFRTFTTNLAVLWKDFAGPFVDTWKDAVAVVKGEIADLVSFAAKILLATDTGIGVGKASSGLTFRFGAGLERIGLAGLGKSVQEFGLQGMGGYEQAEKLGPDAVRKLIEQQRVGERQRIIDERAKQMEADRIARDAAIAEQAAKLDAIRNRQRKNLDQAATPLETLPMPRVAEAQKRITEFVAAGGSRGMFGSDLARQAFGGSGRSLPEKQLKVAEKQLQVEVEQNKNLEALKSLLNKSGYFRVT